MEISYFDDKMEKTKQQRNIINKNLLLCIFYYDFTLFFSNRLHDSVLVSYVIKNDLVSHKDHFSFVWN